MNYEVYEAVWLATAVMTYEVYEKNPYFTIEDISFKQSDIQKRARFYTAKNVDSARISQWCNADHKENTYNYLRDVNGKRRLTFPGEFNGEKEYPAITEGTLIDLEFKSGTEEDSLVIEQLMEFISTEYAAIFKINFHNIVDHLVKYAGVKYINPNRLEDGERDNYVEIRESGRIAVNELNKVSKYFGNKYGLLCPNKSSWLTGGRDVVRDYLWDQLKYADTSSVPTSISIFADNRHDKKNVRFRISIELDEKAATEEDYNRHHSMLNHKFKVDNNFCYYVHFLNGNDSYRTDLSIEQIIQKVQSGEITKVQLVYEIYSNQIEREGLSDEKLLNLFDNAFNYLKPFYDVVVKGNVIDPDGPEEEPMDKQLYDKNIIIYGPPGTGKTYHTALYAVAIIENRRLAELQLEPYDEILELYRNYKESNQIEFTTFHQSYGYEEFIEGIKPVLSNGQNEEGSEIHYEVASGIFKSFCKNAQTLQLSTEGETFDSERRVWKVSIGGSGQNWLKEECFRDGNIRIGWPDADISAVETEGYLNNSLYYFYEEMSKGDIVFSLGDQKHIDAIGIIIGEPELLDDEYYPRSMDVKWVATNIHERIFELNGHKNMSQSAIYPLQRIPLSSVNELILKYAENTSTEIKKNNKNYVFIIDEINRGNISKILGELITLIEPTKRLGTNEAMKVKLPYSQEEFGVPNNVYILGTMNTADRSIAMLDTALRRRFQFVEMLPNSELLNDIYVGPVDVKRMLETINKRIEVLYDREHTIGHAYFMKLKNDPSLETLASIFENAIIPLLQEYFYEDYSKIQLILGDNAKEDRDKFILDEKLTINDVFKNNPDVDLAEKNYRIQADAFRRLSSYVGIYE